MAKIFNFLYFEGNFWHFVIILFSTIVGISFVTSCFSFIKHKLTLTLLALLSWYGLLLLLFWKGTPLSMIGMAFLSMGLGGFLYAILSFHTLSIIRRIFKNNPSLPPDLYVEKEPRKYKKNRTKMCVFFFIIFLSVSVTWAIANAAEKWFLSERTSIIFAIGLIIGPFISTLLASKKGVYSSCVFLIFIAEVSLMCASLYSQFAFWSVIGNLTFGILITSSITICPLLTYYLMGPVSFHKNFSRVLIALLSGGFGLIPLSTLSPEVLMSTQFMMWAIISLLGAFFTLFSTWNHRFVLLK